MVFHNLTCPAGSPSRSVWLPWFFVELYQVSCTVLPLSLLQLQHVEVARLRLLHFFFLILHDLPLPLLCRKFGDEIVHGGYDLLLFLLFFNSVVLLACFCHRRVDLSLVIVELVLYLFQFSGLPGHVLQRRLESVGPRGWFGSLLLDYHSFFIVFVRV